VIATPFVQGRIREETLSITTRTECACCERPIELEIDSEMNCRVGSAGAAPLVSVPLVNARRLDAPNIVDDF